MDEGVKDGHSHRPTGFVEEDDGDKEMEGIACKRFLDKAKGR